MMYEHLPVVDALLAAGVDADASSGSMTPLIYAIAEKLSVPSLASKLIAAGANVDKSSYCARHFSLAAPYGAALEYGRRSTLAMLLRAGATPTTVCRAFGKDHVQRHAQNEAAWALHDAVESAGGWANYCAVCAARRAAGICLCIRMRGRKRIPMELFPDIAAFVPEWGLL